MDKDDDPKPSPKPKRTYPNARKPRFTRTPEQTAIARRLKREASKTERRLWLRLSHGQMGAPFRRQHSVTGRFTDFCCVPLRLVVEVDGPMHDAARDVVRDRRMGREGFDVLRFPVQDLDRDFEGAVSAIYEAVRVRLLAAEHLSKP